MRLLVIIGMLAVAFVGHASDYPPAKWQEACQNPELASRFCIKQRDGTPHLSKPDFSGLHDDEFKYWGVEIGLPFPSLHEDAFHKVAMCFYEQLSADGVDAQAIRNGNALRSVLTHGQKYNGGRDWAKLWEPMMFKCSDVSITAQREATELEKKRAMEAAERQRRIDEYKLEQLRAEKQLVAEKAAAAQAEAERAAIHRQEQAEIAAKQRAAEEHLERAKESAAQAKVQATMGKGVSKEEFGKLVAIYNTRGFVTACGEVEGGISFLSKWNDAESDLDDYAKRVIKQNPTLNHTAAHSIATHNMVLEEDIRYPSLREFYNVNAETMFLTAPAEKKEAYCKRLGEVLPVMLKGMEQQTAY